MFAFVVLASLLAVARASVLVEITVDATAGVSTVVHRESTADVAKVSDLFWLLSQADGTKELLTCGSQPAHVGAYVQDAPKVTWVYLDCFDSGLGVADLELEIVLQEPLPGADAMSGAQGELTPLIEPTYDNERVGMVRVEGLSHVAVAYRRAPDGKLFSTDLINVMDCTKSAQMVEALWWDPDNSIPYAFHYGCQIVAKAGGEQTKKRAAAEFRAGVSKNVVFDAMRANAFVANSLGIKTGSVGDSGNGGTGGSDPTGEGSNSAVSVALSIMSLVVAFAASI